MRTHARLKFPGTNKHVFLRNVVVVVNREFPEYSARDILFIDDLSYKLLKNEKHPSLHPQPWMSEQVTDNFLVANLLPHLKYHKSPDIKTRVEKPPAWSIECRVEDKVKNLSTYLKLRCSLSRK